MKWDKILDSVKENRKGDEESLDIFEAAWIKKIRAGARMQEACEYALEMLDQKKKT